VSRDKVKTIDSIATIVTHQNASNLTTGLISGCFDILHIGHIHLFEFAKANVDMLIVGVDEDQSIRNTKGIHRPVNNQDARMAFLSHISLIDYVFPLDFKGKFGDSASDDFWKGIYKTISPSCVISSTKADRFADSKREIVSGLNIEFLPFDGTIEISSTTIEKIFKHNADFY
jgi:cytidyltransferase-like protein